MSIGNDWKSTMCLENFSKKLKTCLENNKIFQTNQGTEWIKNSNSKCRESIY